MNDNKSKSILLIDASSRRATYLKSLIKNSRDKINIVTAFSAEKARNIMNKRNKPFAFIACYAYLPDSEGLIFAEEIKRKSPDISILLYANDETYINKCKEHSGCLNAINLSNTELFFNFFSYGLEKDNDKGGFMLMKDCFK